MEWKTTKNEKIEIVNKIKSTSFVNTDNIYKFLGTTQSREREKGRQAGRQICNIRKT